MRVFLSVLAVVAAVLAILIGRFYFGYWDQMREVNRERVQKHDQLTVPNIEEIMILREVWQDNHTIFDFCHSRVSEISEERINEWLDNINEEGDEKYSVYRYWEETPDSLWYPKCFEESDALEIRRISNLDGFYYKKFDYRIDDEIWPSWIHHFTLIDHENGLLYQQTYGAIPPG